MPICHRVLLGRLSQQTTTTLRSNPDPPSAVEDAVSAAAAAMTPDNDTLWRGDDSNLTLAKLLNVTFHSYLPSAVGNVSDSPDNVTVASAGGDGAGGGPLERAGTNNSLFVKMVLLLILTAVVLLSTYKFVVRLFSGYSEKKDDSAEFYIGIHDES